MARKGLGGSGFWWKLETHGLGIAGLAFYKESWRNAECWLGFRCQVESYVARIIWKRLFAHLVGVARSSSLWTFPVDATWTIVGRARLGGFFLKRLNYPSTSVIYRDRFPSHTGGIENRLRGDRGKMCKFWKWRRKVKVGGGGGWHLSVCVLGRSSDVCV